MAVSVTVYGEALSNISAVERAYLGHCIRRPFQRDQKNDFANVGGVALVAAAVAQVLGTGCEDGIARGELPWDTEFGSSLERLRHRNPDRVFEELANVYVLDAIQRWEPRAVVTSTRMQTEIIDGESHVFLYVVFDVAASNTPGSEIIARDLTAKSMLS